MSRAPLVEGTSHQLVNWDSCPMSGLLRMEVPGGWIYKIDAGGPSSWGFLFVPYPPQPTEASHG